MRKTRSAYTLMEVVLVFAVIVIAGAIAIPVVQSMFSSSRLDAARDTVRSSLTQARNLAVKESRPFRFDIRNNTGNFRITPDEEVVEDIGMTLPEDVFFCCDDETGEPVEGDWTTLAVFLPDGTADADAEIRIRTQQSPPVVLQLRASTGSVVSAALQMLANPS